MYERVFGACWRHRKTAVRSLFLFNPCVDPRRLPQPGFRETDVQPTAHPHTLRLWPVLTLHSGIFEETIGSEGDNLQKEKHPLVVYVIGVSSINSESSTNRPPPPPAPPHLQFPLHSKTSEPWNNDTAISSLLALEPTAASFFLRLLFNQVCHFFC